MKGRWRDSGSGGVEVGRSASDDTSGGKPKGRKPARSKWRTRRKHHRTASALHAGGTLNRTVDPGTF
ncbi:MAG: hypothetical protein EBY17_26740 [Acidobacteriia bacterium]|nr:hypothetical protein [Terriglobia bacterium]